jgi:hypothetical protein
VPRFFSERERRLWIAVAIAVALLLAALYPLQFVLDALRSRNLLRLSIAALFLACAGSVVGVLARRGARFATWVVVALAAALYALFALAMEVPQERLHLVEYGALALLVRAAIVESVALRPLGRWVSSVDVWTLAGVTLIGWLDEGVQGALPNRQYDLRDVAFNAAAAALALAVATAVRATMRTRGAADPGAIRER